MSVPASSPPRVQRGRPVARGIQTGILMVAGALLTVMLGWETRGTAQPPSSRTQEKQPPDFTSKSLGVWIEALKDRENAELRDRAWKALGPDGPYAKVAVPALIDAFNHKKPPGHWDVAMILAGYGPSGVPRLVRALKRPEAPIRAGVAEALGYVRPRALEAVPALTEALKDPVPDVRAAAAEGLGSIGRSADKAIPSLIS